MSTRRTRRIRREKVPPAQLRRGLETGSRTTFAGGRCARWRGPVGVATVRRGGLAAGRGRTGRAGRAVGVAGFGDRCCVLAVPAFAGV
ncbi:MAG: hypothetical protein ACLPYY_12905 [Acidimicrobiales bacterium]